MKRSPLQRKTPLRAKAPMRKSRRKTTPSRQSARGRPCMVRIPGICNHDTETVVLAHYRLAGTCGVGMKPPDVLGAWCCSACHDEADRRTRITDADHARLCHAEGVLRTLVALAGDGYEFRKGCKA